MSRSVYILAGGGTGGHVYPGLAVAEALRRRDAEAMIVFACSGRAIDRAILDPLDYAVVPQPVQPFPRGWRQWPGFLLAWRRSTKLARRLLDDLRPRAVLGLGGFAAGPVVHVALRRRVPSALLNPDAVAGKANRHLARRVDAIFTQFPATAGAFPSDLRAKVRCVGCPVRETILHGERDRALEHFGLRKDRHTLLVFGGSTLAASLTEAVSSLAGDLRALGETWQVLAVTGAQRQASTAAALGDAGVALAYCDRMDLAYAAADLAMSRGGAGTVAELTATGTPAVILPYPHHADRQQYRNAQSLLEAGAAKVVDDRADPAGNTESLRRELLPILRNPERLASLQAAATGISTTTPAEDDAARMTRCRK